MSLNQLKITLVIYILFLYKLKYGVLNDRTPHLSTVVCQAALMLMPSSFRRTLCMEISLISIKLNKKSSQKLLIKRSVKISFACFEPLHATYKLAEDRLT